MKKCIFLIIALMLVATQHHLAQQLTPFVISTSGGFSTNTSGMLSFTTGEMSAVETYNAATHILTQGFQQAWDFSTSIHGSPLSGFSFDVYPNPSGGFFQLVSEWDEDEQVIIHVMDLLGKEILKMEYDHKRGLHFQSLDLAHLPQGVYLISVKIAGHAAHDAYPFVGKINIVR